MKTFYNMFMKLLFLSLFKQFLIWPHAPWKIHHFSLTLCLCLQVDKRYNKTLSQGFCLPCAAVRFPCFLFLTFFLCFCRLLFHSKPAMWVPRSFWRGQSRGRRRWSWIWRWSQSTMSSTSEAAPSYVWRYLSQSILSEYRRQMSRPQRILLLSSAADLTVCLTQVIHF